MVSFAESDDYYCLKITYNLFAKFYIAVFLLNHVYSISITRLVQRTMFRKGNRYQTTGAVGRLPKQG